MNGHDESLRNWLRSATVGQILERHPRLRPLFGRFGFGLEAFITSDETLTEAVGVVRRDEGEVFIMLEEVIRGEVTIAGALGMINDGDELRLIMDVPRLAG